MPTRHAPALELLRTVTVPADLQKAAVTLPPFGPAFDSAAVQEADRMEVWGTTETAWEDYTEFRLLKDTQIIGVARIPGY